MKKIKTIKMGPLAVLIVLLLSLPWLLYAIGLSNIAGRPSVPVNVSLNPEEAQAIWKELKEEGPIQVEIITPWLYVIRILEMNDKPRTGERLAWFVAQNYNGTHLKDKRMIYWHLSGAALTIWLTQNWSAEQLLLKAKEIQESKKHLTFHLRWTRLCRAA